MVLLGKIQIGVIHINISKPIKGIFFDIGHTLIYPSTGHWMLPKITEDLIDINAIYKMSINEFSSCYQKCMDYLDDNRLIKTIDEECEQFITFYSMLAKFIPKLNLTKENIELIVHDKVFNTDNYIFHDDVYDTLSALKDNYKLGLISDTWPSMENLLKEAKLYDLFDSITFSCYLGVCKPNPKMYEHAIDLINIPAEQTIFIDDHKENLIGAQKLGIQPILINTKNKKKDADFLTIFSLSEIIDYL